MMLQEENSLVINEMKKTDFYLTAQREISNILAGLAATYERFTSL